MQKAFHWFLLPIALAIFIHHVPRAQAQTDKAETSVIRGALTEQATGQPVPGITLTLRGTGLTAQTDLQGNYEFVGVPAGTYQIELARRLDSSNAQAILVAPVSVVTRPGMVASADVTIELGDGGEVIEVSGSSVQDRLSGATDDVQVVDEVVLEKKGGAHPNEALADVKGLDYSDAGILVKRFSARGFDSHFNSRMLFMIDGRVVVAPGNGVVDGVIAPISPLDMQSVEAVLGPASALYGANAHSGVINIRTKTPWDESGAAISLRGGSRDLVDVAARVAGTIGDSFGWKLNAQLVSAEDLQPDRSSPTHYYGTSFFESDLLHDYNTGIRKLDGALYYNYKKWRFLAGAGLSRTDVITFSSLGRFSSEGYEYSYLNFRATHPSWYFRVNRNATSNGFTYLINNLAARAEQRSTMGQGTSARSLDPVREELKLIGDNSVVDSEGQYRHTVDSINLDIIAGGQVRYYSNGESNTVVDPMGEDISSLTEWGAYAQASYPLLADRLRLTAAARVDGHTSYSAQLSPKAAAFYTVADGHRVRASYNRAFRSPANIQNYLFINDGLIRGNRYGYTVRTADGQVLREIDPLEPERVDTVELGYRGRFSDKLVFDVSLYNGWYRDFISPLSQVSNPFDPENPTFAHDQDGARINPGAPIEGALLTYANFGETQVRGLDVGFSLYPTRHIELAGSASFISLGDFEAEENGPAELLLNVPERKLRGSITIDSWGMDNYFIRLSARYQSAYAFESGYWNSTALLADQGGELPSRTVIDIGAGYDIDIPNLHGMTIQAHVVNLLDDDKVDVLGAPVSQRMFYTQLVYRHRGL